MSKKGSTTLLVVSVGSLGLSALLAYLFVDMRKQRDVAVAAATNLAEQMVASVNLVTGAWKTQT